MGKLSITAADRVVVQAALQITVPVAVPVTSRKRIYSLMYWLPGKEVY